jgi:hypothetical protein
MAKTPKPFQPVAATANALRTGDVVFRSTDGVWSRDVTHAEVAETTETAAKLQAAAEGDAVANLVIDPVLIPVVREGGLIRPVALREIIRARGPTIDVPPDSRGT